MSQQLAVNQGQTATLSVAFRTPVGDAVTVYRESGLINEGINITIKRGGLTVYTGVNDGGSSDAYTLALTFHHSVWSEGIYQVTCSGYTTGPTAVEQTVDLIVYRSYVFAVVGDAYRIADLMSFLADAIGNGPFPVEGEVAYGITDGLNSRFTVMGKNIVPGSVNLVTIEGGARDTLSEGDDYTINYDSGVITTISPPSIGEQLIVGYQHTTYSKDELMQALVRACSALQQRDLLAMSVTSGEPTIDTDPADIFNLLMLSAQVAILEMQAQRDARRGLDFSDRGLSVRRQYIAERERALLKDLKQQLDSSIAQAAMDGFTSQPPADRIREWPEIILSTVFEVAA